MLWSKSAEIGYYSYFNFICKPTVKCSTRNYSFALFNKGQFALAWYFNNIFITWLPNDCWKFRCTWKCVSKLGFRWCCIKCKCTFGNIKAGCNFVTHCYINCFFKCSVIFICISNFNFCPSTLFCFFRCKSNCLVTYFWSHLIWIKHIPAECFIHCAFRCNWWCKLNLIIIIIIWILTVIKVNGYAVIITDCSAFLFFIFAHLCFLWICFICDSCICYMNIRMLYHFIISI